MRERREHKRRGREARDRKSIIEERERIRRQE